MVREGGTQVGAIFETESGYVRVNAKKGVMLATGGYAANLAMWAGAAKDLTSAMMVLDRGLPAPGTPAGYTSESIEAGERFANESADYDYLLHDHLPHAAVWQPNGTYISVRDGNFGEDVQRFHTLGCSAETRMGVQAFKKEDGSYDLDGCFQKQLEDGRLQKADMLEELADKFGFDVEAKKTFLATCKHYNELYDAQEDTDFFKESYRLSELRTPLFFGATLLTTIDGIRINADCQAIDT